MMQFLMKKVEESKTFRNNGGVTFQVGGNINWNFGNGHITYVRSRHDICCASEFHFKIGCKRYSGKKLLEGPVVERL